MAERLTIGIDVGGTTTKGGLVTRDGKVLDRVERSTRSQAATKEIIAVAESLLARAKEAGREVAAIGVGAAGFIDHDLGTVTFSPNVVYDDPDLDTALGGRLDLPVAVDNDANAAAWAEYRFGAAAGCENLALLTLGTGIGSGFVVDGRLLRGSRGAGAELGHMVVDPSGPQCACGLRGCLEQYASGTGIADQARRVVSDDPRSAIVTIAGSAEVVTSEHVVQAANDFDETALAILRSSGRMLGVGLSNVVNIFDPEVIVLAGSVVNAGECLLGPARDELARSTNAQRRKPVRLDVSTLGKDGGIIGAAALALDELEGTTS